MDIQKGSDMTETRTTMVPIKIDKACDCGGGKMIFTGKSKWQGENYHTHKCTGCGKMEDYQVIYPRIVHEPISGDHHG